MLLLVHVHVRFGFSVIDTTGSILEKRIDWKQLSIIVAIRLRQRSLK